MKYLKMELTLKKTIGLMLLESLIRGAVWTIIIYLVLYFRTMISGAFDVIDKGTISVLKATFIFLPIALILSLTFTIAFILFNSQNLKEKKSK